MKKLLLVLAVLTLGITGCVVQNTDRQAELSDVQGKKVSEAMIRGSDQVVIRFTDGTMLEIEESDGALKINNQND